MDMKHYDGGRGERLRVIAFDFDGVIVDTATAKLEAFCALFPPDEVTRRYLSETQGRPRFERFEWVCRNVLRVPYSAAVEAKLDHELSARLKPVLDSVESVPGVRDAIGRVPPDVVRVIVSAAPPGDVTRLLAQIGMDGLFARVMAGVSDKAGTFGALCGEYEIQPSEMLYLGDTTNDRLAAQSAGVLFVGVSVVTEAAIFRETGTPHITKFSDLEFDFRGGVLVCSHPVRGV